VIGVVAAALVLAGVLTFAVGEKLRRTQAQLDRARERLSDLSIACSYLIGAVNEASCPVGDECDERGPCEMHNCARSAQWWVRDVEDGRDAARSRA